MNSIIPKPSCFYASNNTGLSLIEVLVSILILSFGFLGVIKTQLIAIQSAQQSHFYSLAMELASDIAEKIRRTRQLPLSTPLILNFQADNETLPASLDLSEWMVKTTLPHARVVICRDSSPWNTQNQRLTWDCNDADPGASVIIKIGWAEKQDDHDIPPPLLALAVAAYAH